MYSEFHEQETNVDAAINRIRGWMRRNDVSQIWMAGKSGLHVKTLSGMYRETWSPTVNTVRALEKVISEDPRS